MSVACAVAQSKTEHFTSGKNGSGAQGKMGESGPRLARVTGVLPLAHENG
jgi:hypothetical protein